VFSKCSPSPRLILFYKNEMSEIRDNKLKKIKIL
jgi:hypothetical protein